MPIYSNAPSSFLKLYGNMKKVEAAARERPLWAELVLPYLPPADLAAVASTCSSLHRLCLSITSLRSSDASRSFEIHPIPFINPVDSQPPYSYFIYTPTSILPSPVFPQPWGGGSLSGPPSPPGSKPDNLIGSGCGCDCGCRCVLSTCPCRHQECGSDCPSRSTQRGISTRLRIVRHPLKGWGLHAGEKIEKSQFVCEYAGEYLTTEEARRRQRAYDERSPSSSAAMMVVREHLPSGKACLRVNIDATRVGNVGRFINHACDGGNLVGVLVRESGGQQRRLGKGRSCVLTMEKGVGRRGGRFVIAGRVLVVVCFLVKILDSLVENEVED